MQEILKKYRALGASDLHLRDKKPLYYRLKGRLYQGEESVSAEEWKNYFQGKQGSDFSLSSEEGRYRVNLARGEGGEQVSIRIISQSLHPQREEIKAVFRDLEQMKDGLVLVTGATGSGKSSTLRYFLESFNERQAKKIISLEDPIEHYYEEKKSIFFQRELGRDYPSFAAAMKEALRQDPDILMLGEIRDAESLEALLYFAESGHLVLSTLHTRNCVESIHKMIAMTEASRQEEVRKRLSTLLRYLIAQEFQEEGEERFLVYEILKNGTAVANMIANGREGSLTSILESSAKEGMCTKRQSRQAYIARRKKGS